MAKFPKVIKVADLDGTNGFVLNGEAAFDNSGVSVSDAGDVNGDEVGDLIIGARGVDGSAAEGGNVGASYVVFGVPTSEDKPAFPRTFELSSLNGDNGFKINGKPADDGGSNWELGWSVSSAGDMDGDGIDDVVIATEGKRIFDASDKTGSFYVLYGHKGKDVPFSKTFDVASLDGKNGFEITGAAKGGFSVSSAGDVNGDGFDDVVLGSWLGSTSYVVFGHAKGTEDNPSPKSFDLFTLDGANGFALKGEDEFDQTGIAVSAAGDVNGDGVDDLIVGAPEVEKGGRVAGGAYVVFGRSELSDEGSFAKELKVSDLDGTNGFAIFGAKGDNELGASVASAGDVNGDGVGDLIVGSPSTTSKGVTGGAAYVMFGHKGGTDADPFDDEFDVSKLNGVNGFRIDGLKSGDEFGAHVASAGDVNGDGFADLIVSAPGAKPDGSESGSTYVVFGHEGGTKKNPFAKTFDLSKLDGENGFRIDGEKGSRSGGAVSSAGDLNNDGFDDLVVGATNASPHGQWSGKSYVIYGHPSFLPPTIELSASTVKEFAKDGTIVGKLSVSNAPDLKGKLTYSLLDDAGDRFSVDGTVLRVADGLKLDFEQHEEWVLKIRVADKFGHSLKQTVTVNVEDINPEFLKGSPRDDDFYGGDQLDNLWGEGGNDTLVGGKGDDNLHGSKGSDQLEGGKGGDYLDGGDGIDTVSYAHAEATYVPPPPEIGDDGKPEGELQESEGLLVSLGRPEFNNGEAKDDSYYSIENLIGSDYKDRLIGNTKDNTIEGGNGSDWLDGSAGNDVLVGGAGADKLDGGGSNSNEIDIASYENADSAVTASLTQPKDNTGEAKGDTYRKIDGFLGSSHYDTLIGNSNANVLKGGGGKDKLDGGGGADKLYGGTGKDRLTGGSGDDKFYFDTALSKKLNVDTVSDFSHKHDTIALDHTIFDALKKGDLSSKAFFAGSKAHDLDDHILYNSQTGALSYDDDGNKHDGHSAVQFATLGKGLSLDASDFLVV